MTRDEVRRYDVFGDLYGETQWVRYKDYDKALAAVEAERDALAAVVEVLRQYYQRKADDDQLYEAFCTWRTAVRTITAAKREVANDAG